MGIEAQACSTTCAVHGFEVEPLTEFIIAALAVWRISVLAVEEEGPWGIAAWLRWQAGIEVYPDGTRVESQRFTAKLLSCVRCTSMWLALAATVVLWPDSWQAWVLLPFGLSGAAVAIEVFRR